MPARFSAWASSAATRSRPAPRLEVAADGVELHVLLGPAPPGDGLVALAPGLGLAPAPREEVERLGDHGEHVEVGARHEVVGPGPPVLHRQVERRVGEAAGGLRGLLRPLGLRASGGGEWRVGAGEGHRLGQGQRLDLGGGPGRAATEGDGTSGGGGAAGACARRRGGAMGSSRTSNGMRAAHHTRGEPVENRRAQRSTPLTRAPVRLSFRIVMSMEAAVRPGARVRRGPSARRAESLDQA